MLNKHEVNERFGHTDASIEGPHSEDVEATHQAIREKFMKLCEDLDVLVPDSRQKVVALENLETASMWFHKALAHNADLV